MAFFDDLGKKISKTSQGVVQKTKDTAESIKLGGMVSDEEKRINGLYTEIGKLYFELHADSCEADFENMITAIKESKVKIADYSEQIKKLKGIVNCTNCGGEVPYNAPFCSSCGAKMSMEPEQKQQQNSTAVQRCSNCGVPIYAGSAFCTSCGTKIQATPVAPVEQPQATPVQQSQSAPVYNEPVANTCPNCGREITPGAKFCVGCGSSL